MGEGIGGAVGEEAGDSAAAQQHPIAHPPVGLRALDGKAEQQPQALGAAEVCRWGAIIGQRGTKAPNEGCATSKQIKAKRGNMMEGE